MSHPSVILAGGGAAGLWTAMALVDAGWPGERVTVVEPDAKTADDHTWGYWARSPLVPAEAHFCAASKLVLREGGRDLQVSTEPYRYFCLRSSAFYAYAKRRLRAAGVGWRSTSVEALSVAEGGGTVVAQLADGGELRADYALDSRPVDLEAIAGDHNTTLQHFGGYFVEAASDCFEADRVVFMDFVEAGDREVAFFYVVPAGPRRAIVELAVLSLEPWRPERYDAALDAYLADRYPDVDLRVDEREYGVIPMTDAPLWRASTSRVWAIGTRGGWVQPSSGYAFARTARFAHEVAHELSRPTPQPWRPSPVQQVFNATMLRYVNERPGQAGRVFFDLFARNGAPRTFRFLDEDASLGETLALMWNSPRLPFAGLAVRETAARVTGMRG